jgi:hypothetical protein
MHLKIKNALPVVIDGKEHDNSFLYNIEKLNVIIFIN